MEFMKIPQDVIERIEKFMVREQFAPDAETFVGTVCIEKRYGRKGIQYAVTHHGNCMTKSGEFWHEPLPSSRNEEFLSATRFDSLEQAWNAFHSFFPVE